MHGSFVHWYIQGTTYPYFRSIVLCVLSGRRRSPSSGAVAIHYVFRFCGWTYADPAHSHCHDCSNFYVGRVRLDSPGSALGARYDVCNCLVLLCCCPDRQTDTHNRLIALPRPQSGYKWKRPDNQTALLWSIGLGPDLQNILQFVIRLS